MANHVRAAIASAAGLVVVVLLALPASARPPAPQKTAWAAADLLPLTCAQAWVKAGRSYPQMVAIVKTLARVSLANRDLTFPNTREAGLEAGRGIVADCKADPHGLLFATVDEHVRKVAKPAAGRGR